VNNFHFSYLSSGIILTKDGVKRGRRLGCRLPTSSRVLRVFIFEVNGPSPLRGHDARAHLCASREAMSDDVWLGVLPLLPPRQLR
jgi:hypothetical protein